MVGAPALSLELSCRYVTPLLDIADAEGLTDGVGELIAPWQVTLPELRDESNWVSLRFCEALVDWLGARVGADTLATRVAQAAMSPRTLGVLYPVLRAIGSPRIGYGALPQLVPRMNKVSAVAVSGVRRGLAEIEYRPADPAHKEESPLVCQLRRAQIAAGPTLWGLPPARVDESQLSGARRRKLPLSRFDGSSGPPGTASPWGWWRAVRWRSRFRTPCR